jgi:diguanylate cyclase (GGDEF)-like protein
LIEGCLLSLLLGGLVFALGIRQRRALPRARVPATRESLYDALTGLPNSMLTLDLAERMLARTGRQSGMLAGALLIDVDWFKDLNDKLGRDAGDELLGIVAQRLQRVVRAHDTVGYLGEDTFVVLVEAQARGARLESLVRRVMDVLHKPLELRGFGPGIHLTASIGLAFGRYTSTDELLRDAQLALDDAKSAGKNRFTVFNANLRSRIEDRGVLEMELNAALQDGQLGLAYQPISDVRTRRPVYLEALVRWTHPKRGEVSPEDFMPLAEDTGLDVPIGRWALEEACVRMAAWNVEGHRLSLLVAISAGQLNRDGLATDVRRALQQSGLDASLLVLAVPESTVIDDIPGAAARLEEIRRLGVRVAIDDFGNGYTYRSELRRLPVEVLRVHRGSLAAADDEDYRSWLLEAILSFAKDLSLAVIVSGVESEEQMASLQAMGCALAEGALVGAPIPAESVASLLADQSGSAVGSAPSGDAAAAIS